MNRKSRAWIGITLFVVLLFNYAMIGLPLYRKAINLHDKATTMLMKQIKSGNALRTSSEEDYILEIFRREKMSIDRKLLILNSIGITLAILIASWTVFGLIVPKRRNSK